MSDEKNWRDIEQALRRPPVRDVDAEARVLEHIETLPLHRPPVHRRIWEWLVAPRLVRVSPLATMAAVSVVVVAGWLLVRETPSATDVTSPASVAVAAGVQPVNFSLVAPSASQVSVVGDFNDWSTSRHAMQVAEGGVWSITVALSPGRHTYAFLVDGVLWLPDENAPRAPEDEFGRESSVVLVRSGGMS